MEGMPESERVRYSTHRVRGSQERRVKACFSGCGTCVLLGRSGTACRAPT